jgi:hypothetical protein
MDEGYELSYKIAFDDGRSAEDEFHIIFPLIGAEKWGCNCSDGLVASSLRGIATIFDWVGLL